MMKIKCGIISILLFASHLCMAQNESKVPADLLFGPYLTRMEDNDTLTIPASLTTLHFQQQAGFKNLTTWKQVKTIDPTKKWRLIGLEINYSESGQYAFIDSTRHYVQLKSKDTISTFNADTLNNYFVLNGPDIRTTHDWSQFNTSIDWTPFCHEKYLVIEKYDLFIGNIRTTETMYAYYFEEIE